MADYQRKEGGQKMATREQATIKVLGLGEEWALDEWERYGTVRVQVDGKTYDVGVVIGVPDSQRQEVEASGGRMAPYLTAWYADADDWAEARCEDGSRGVPRRDEVLSSIHAAARRLWDEL